jgi:hypothetical protein
MRFILVFGLLRLKPDPVLLFNIGQSYRNAHASAPTDPSCGASLCH